jgi:ribosome-associated toxin RatA of RatAB toxin-antitoxin module
VGRSRQRSTQVKGGLVRGLSCKITRLVLPQTIGVALALEARFEAAMANISRSALVPYSPSQMFALVSDIESYPSFLPWCKSSRILSVKGDEVRAVIELSKGAVHKSFTTHNRAQRDKMIEMRLVEGPFHHLEGFWRFDALADLGCRVALDLEFEFSGRLVKLAFGPVFNQVVNSLVDSFHRRARQIYGER